jgi:hypothetical protein
MSPHVQRRRVETLFTAYRLANGINGLIRRKPPLNRNLFFGIRRFAARSRSGRELFGRETRRSQQPQALVSSSYEFGPIRLADSSVNYRFETLRTRGKRCAFEPYLVCDPYGATGAIAFWDS